MASKPSAAMTDARRGWLKNEMDEVRIEVAAWPAWKRGEMMTDARPRNCPTCESPASHLHPAMQSEGEVQPCKDPWHQPQPQPDAQREPVTREEVAAIEKAYEGQYGESHAANAVMRLIWGYRALADRLAEAEKRAQAWDWSPLISTCPNGHRFRTTQDHPAKSEREWHCLQCTIDRLAASEQARRQEATEGDAVLLAHRDQIDTLEQRLAEVERERDAFKSLAECNAKRIEERDKRLADAQATMARLEKDGAALSAGQCIVKGGVVGDDGGTPYCTREQQVARLRDAHEEAYQVISLWFKYFNSDIRPIEQWTEVSDRVNAWLPTARAIRETGAIKKTGESVEKFE